MDLQTTMRCPISGQHARFYCRKQETDYLINQKNGVIFLKNMPDVQHMQHYANTHYQAGVYQDYMKAGSLKLLTANFRLDQIRQYQPGKKMLDVGCASGFFLEAAQSRGYEVQGIEFAAAAIAGAAPSVRDKIIHGDVHQELGRWQQNLDWVSAFDIIEHMHDPVKFIKDVRKILKPGGLLVMSTPDTGHFLRRLMGASWPMLQPFQHTVLFSRKAMTQMLTANGFTDIKIKTTHKYLTFEYLAGQLTETNRLISSMMRVMMSLIPKFMARHPFRVNIGEFIVFARKG